MAVWLNDSQCRMVIATTLVVATLVLLFRSGDGSSSSASHTRTTTAADTHKRPARPKVVRGTLPSCLWQASDDELLSCESRTFSGVTAPAKPQSFTWHLEPDFMLVANTQDDYITHLSQPETNFFEYHNSRWFVSILDQVRICVCVCVSIICDRSPPQKVRRERGRDGPDAEQPEYCETTDPVWMMDVGANIGVHTLYVAAEGYGVVAVEGFPATGGHLSCSKILNRFDHVYVIPRAVSRTERTLCFSNSVANVGGNLAMASVQAACGEAFRARALPLDRLLRAAEDAQQLKSQRILGPPALLKVDVEGSEGEVFATLQEHFASPAWRPNYIFVELVPDFLRNFNSSFVRVAQTVISYGYAMWTADHTDDLTSKLLAMTPEQESKLPKIPCHNFLFIHERSSAPPPNPKACAEYNY